MKCKDNDNADKERSAIGVDGADKPIQRDAIVIAFCISDSFAQHAAVVMASALANTPNEKLEFHILSGDLTEMSRERLVRMTSERCAVFIYNVDRSIFDAYPTPLHYILQETYYRYLIPRLINRNRVIYSDVDVLVAHSLRLLWEAPLKGRALGAIKEYNEYHATGSKKEAGWRAYKVAIGMKPDSTYYYAGLLLMDCEALRQIHFTERCLEETARCAKALSADDFSAADQVVLNRVFEGKFAELSPMWCVTSGIKSVYKGVVGIWHYAGYYEKPWCDIAWNTSWLLYLKYLLQTPYSDRAWHFALRQLRGIIWSSHIKKGWRRYFLFGLRIYKTRP